MSKRLNTHDKNKFELVLLAVLMNYQNPLLMLSKNEAIRYLSLAITPTSIATGSNFIRLERPDYVLYARPCLHGFKGHLWNEEQLTDGMMLSVYKNHRPFKEVFISFDALYTLNDLFETIHNLLCKNQQPADTKGFNSYFELPKATNHHALLYGTH